MEIERMKSSAASYNRTTEGADTKTEAAYEAKSTSQNAAQGSTIYKTTDDIFTEDTQEEQDKAVSSKNSQIRKAVEEINKKAHNSEAIFGIHDATNRVTIKIVDKDSKEVLKEYPPEKTLDMIAKLWEIAGLLVDEKL